MPCSISTWLAVSTSECTPSLSIAEDPVKAAATNLGAATAALPISAATTTRRPDPGRAPLHCEGCIDGRGSGVNPSCTRRGSAAREPLWRCGDRCPQPEGHRVEVHRPRIELVEHVAAHQSEVLRLYLFAVPG